MKTYCAIYAQRCDGDYDLVAVINNDYSYSKQIISDIKLHINMNGDEWHIVERNTCDFPDVWESY